MWYPVHCAPPVCVQGLSLGWLFPMHLGKLCFPPQLPGGHVSPSLRLVVRPQLPGVVCHCRCNQLCVPAAWSSCVAAVVTSRVSPSCPGGWWGLCVTIVATSCVSSKCPGVMFYCCVWLCVPLPPPQLSGGCASLLLCAPQVPGDYAQLSLCLAVCHHHCVQLFVPQLPEGHVLLLLCPVVCPPAALEGCV